MKVALVGVNSSISRALISIFKDKAQIITLGRKDADIIVDLNNHLKEVTLGKDVDIVIHTSAHFGGVTYEAISEALMVNVLGALKMIHTANVAGVKHFVYISSIFSHLGPTSKNYNIYSITKKSAEDVLKLFCKGRNIKLTILRPSQIYGNFESNRINQPFFYSIIEKVKNNQEVVFYGTHDPIRNFIHIEDVAEIIYKTVEMGIEGDYDCVFYGNITFTEIAIAAKLAFNSSSEILFDPNKPDIEDNVTEINTRLYDLIDYYPKITIEEGMRRLASIHSE
jgi:nucleoside-diphosphate-sugar epimerase